MPAERPAALANAARAGTASVLAHADGGVGAEGQQTRHPPQVVTDRSGQPFGRGRHRRGHREAGLQTHGQQVPALGQAARPVAGWPAR